MFTTSTGPKLIVPALAGSSVELYAKFDPTLPLTPGLSIENARYFFNHRITSSINRIKTCPKPRACLDSSILWKPADLLIASKLSLYNQPQSNIGDLSTGKVWAVDLHWEWDSCATGSSNKILAETNLFRPSLLRHVEAIRNALVQRLGREDDLKIGWKSQKAFPCDHDNNNLMYSCWLLIFGEKSSGVK